jgi:hypothetical protein
MKTKKSKTKNHPSRKYQPKQIEPLTFGAVPRYLTKAEVAKMLLVAGRYINQLVAGDA